jgi:hypothetical protein
VLTARDLEGQEQLLARFGADRAFQFTLPVIEKAHIARFVLFDTSRNAEVIDSATNKPGGRLIITNPAGEELLVGPRARPLDTSAPLKVFMFEPPHAGVRDTRVLLVRACSPSGRVVARILFQPGS